MPLYTAGPFYGVGMDINAGNSQAIAQQPYNNTHTLIVYNYDATESVYIGWGAAGQDISGGGGGVILPPQTSITLPIGRFSLRVGDSGKQLTFQHSGGAGTVQISVTYINGLES